jgi:3',5'-cyclic AMP phosphodiesterase CpdA
MKRKAADTARDPGTVRFAWLSDLHLSPEPDLEPYIRRFTEAVESAVRAAPDFTLITGDLVDQAEPESYALFRRLAPTLPGPVYVLPGNHDVGEKRFDGAPPGSVVDAEKLARFRAEAGATWQSFEVQGHHFYLLTSSLFGSGLPDEAAQWEWLENGLASRNRAPSYLVFHHPLYLSDPEELGGNYWNVEPEPRTRFLGLLEKHRIPAVFTGHIHRGLRHCYRGTRLLTQTAVSFGLGMPEERVEGWSVVTLRDHVPEIDFRRLTPGGPEIREPE